jgi:drug/metabolite transporter (DMT)-like permease
MSRSAAELGMGALPFITWRGLIATVVLLPVVWWVGRRVGPGHGLRDLPRHRRRALVAVCLIGAVLNIAMFQAFLLTTIAVVLMCFYTFPAIVTIAAVPLYGERIDGIRAGALVLSGVGLILVVLAPVLSSSDVVINPVGVLLAFAAAICQATFILMVGRGFDPLPPVRVSVLALFAAAAVAIPLALITGNTAGFTVPFETPEAWIWILAAGIAGAAIPTTAFVTGIGIIGPSRAAIMMTIEPLVGVVLAALLLGERPAPIQLVGGAAVLVAAAILQVAPRTAVPREPEIGPIV